MKALPEDAEAELPTWWTNKLAVSSAYINGARDYLVYSTEMKDEDVEDNSDEMSSDDDMLPPSVREMMHASETR